VNEFIKKDKEESLINIIINTGIISVAIIAIPLNVIIYFALRYSEIPILRLLPVILGIVLILLAFFRNSIALKYKTWFFIFLLFSAACFNLALSLIDMASLWFLLTIIFTLLATKRAETLYVFIFSILMVVITGFLMIIQKTTIPINYYFNDCEVVCVSSRIIHFILIGFLVYFILNKFFKLIKSNINELEDKNLLLENLNISLKQEMAEKKGIQKKMLNAVIMTEEQERKRIAADLHDGLGPVLSSVSLYFQAYLDAPEKQKPEIETRLKDIVDNAVSEVSRISHNISPRILEKFGLTTALNSFISGVLLTKKINIVTDFEKIDRFDLKSEITIYRVISELINNSIKHSLADTINIKMFLSEKQLKVVYKDNGKGFDVSKVQSESLGMGLNSIQNRINSLSGSITIDSAADKGVEVKILLPIFNNEN